MTANSKSKEEAIWLKADEPLRMLKLASALITNRKLRLLSCACCRHFKEFLASGPFLDAIECAELFADGKTTKAALKRARQGVCAVRHALSDDTETDRVEWVSLWLSEVAASVNAFGGVVPEIERFISEGLLQPNERPPVEAMIRCLFENPFQPTAIASEWQTSEVVSLAQTIYETSEYDKLVVAKELRKAGCTDKEILKHCRSKEPHVRGCWVVDLLLNKS